MNKYSEMRTPFCLYTILLAISVSCCTPAAAQLNKQRIVHYTIKDGLPGNETYSMYQDRKGFIWICTSNGLARFDGRVMKRYTVNDGLPDNDVFSAAEDDCGRLWLACYNAAPCYIESGRVYTAANDPQLNLFCRKMYYTLIPRLHTRELYLKSCNQVISGNARNIREVNSRLQLLYAQHFIELNRHNVIYQYRNKLYLETTSRVTDSFALAGPVKFMFNCGESDVIVISDQNRYQIISAVNGKLISRKTGVLWFSPVQINYAAGKTWVCTRTQGLISFETGFPERNQASFPFPEQSVGFFFSDREQNHWVCTANNGLYFIPNNKIPVLNKNNGLYHDNIYLLGKYGNGIIMGFENGMVQQYLNGKLSSKIFSGTRAEYRVTGLAAPGNRIIAGFDHHFGIHRNNNQVYGTSQAGSVKDIALHPQLPVVYIANHITVTPFNYQSNQPLVPQWKREKKSIVNERTTSVLAVPGNYLYTGTLNGIRKYHLHPQTGAITGIADSLLLNNSRVSDLAMAGDMLLVATVQNGLYILYRNRQFNINTKQGLPDNHCKKIAVGAGGRIWLATNKGICKLVINDPETGAADIQVINQQKGLPSDCVNDVCELNNTLYAATAEGLAEIPVVFPNVQEAGNQVFIQSCTINNREQPLTEKHLRLPHSANNIRLELSAPHFSSLGEIQFRYRFTPGRGEWINCSNPFLELNNLSPGNYTIEVGALTQFGVPFKQNALFSFQIRKAWWQTTFFRVTLALASLLFIILLTQWVLKRKHRQHLKKEQQEKQMIELELKAIKAQINPHFIFNSLNSIQFMVNKNNTTGAGDYLSKLGTMIRQTMDISGKTVHTLTEEIRYLENYLAMEQTRFSDSFTVQIINETRNEKLTIPTLVVQPHVENAIRHGLRPKKTGAKQLTIRFRESGACLLCEIDDNGVGRKAAASKQPAHAVHYQSHGTILSESRLNLVNKLTGGKTRTEITDKYYPDNSPAGTRVTLYIKHE